MRVTVAIGADHGGFALKNELAGYLRNGYEVIDLGAFKFDQDDDYPQFALAVATAVISGRASRGIVVCGSGVGACVAANKVKGIRAAICHDTYSAHQGVEHDDMNVLCLGARVIGSALALELTAAFLNAKFSDAEQHNRRLKMVTDTEQLFFKE